jgi:ubiquinone/menaquinone biosynthesis C-methylase UbiE
MIKEQRLYRDLAKYYDLIYSKKDYKAEVDELRKTILKYKKSKGKELLEVACGTGKHLQYLKSFFNCTGVDINKEILNIAKSRIKDVSFINANMINMNLKKKFDIITCLFSSIGYVQTYENLRKTVENFSKHLNKEGIVVIEPWFTKNSYKRGIVRINTHEDDKIKIARVSYSDIGERNLSIQNMNYLVGENGKGVKYFSEIHKLGLFETKKTLEIMKDAGFRAIYLKDGLKLKRGLYVCIKVK